MISMSPDSAAAVRPFPSRAVTRNLRDWPARPRADFTSRLPATAAPELHLRETLSHSCHSYSTPSRGSFTASRIVSVSPTFDGWGSSATDSETSLTTEIFRDADPSKSTVPSRTWAA